MSLFKTGFAVDAIQPVRGNDGAGSSGHGGGAGRKRKRAGGDHAGVASSTGSTSRSVPTSKAAQTQEAQINLEKLMKKLKDVGTGGGGKGKHQSGSSQSKQQVAKATSHVEKATFATTSTPKPGSGQQKRNFEQVDTSDGSKQARQPKAKPTNSAAPYTLSETDLEKQRQRREKKTRKQAGPGAGVHSVKKAANGNDSVVEDVTSPSSNVVAEALLPSGSNALTALQKSMQKKLGGARFRWINEQLYTTTGEKAHEIMKDDPSVFDEYHSGFRSQASSWPAQPVQLFISALVSEYDSGHQGPKVVIADLGCGDAQLAQDLVSKGFTVLSFDLISVNAWVVQAQCTRRVPLPGGFGTASAAAIVDVVVCCLSLMGNDWLGMITEARRILKQGGKLKIAEVTSRFTDGKAFIKLIEECGFKLLSKDESNTHFIMFEFEAVFFRTSDTQSSEEDLTTRSQNLLKPCLYKKR
ncbi:25S rRNA (adenine645-N1)-methyltransferase [Cystobasidiomycetes sp. EMM_F5]